MHVGIHRNATSQAHRAFATSMHGALMANGASAANFLNLMVALLTSVSARLWIGLLALSAVPTLAAAQSQVVLQTTETKKADPSDPAQIVWADVIEEQKEYLSKLFKKDIQKGEIPLFLSSTGKLETKEGTLYMSIASRRGCISGANNFNSGVEPSQCQARIYRMSNGKPEIIAKGPACLMENMESAKHKSGTEATYDQQLNLITLKTFVNGKIWEDCNFTIKMQ